MITDYLVSQAERYEIIKPCDRDLYKVSISTFIFCCLNWMSLLGLGLLHNSALLCMAFMVAYLPLRIFGGGMHFSTKKRCYCFSLFIYSVMFAICRFELYNSVLYRAILFISFPVIILIAPQEDANKPLTVVERKRNRHIFTLLVCLEVVVLFVMHHYKAEKLFYFTSFAVLLMFFQLVFGKLRNMFRTKYCNTKN